jgi:hypothetical protein
MKKSLCFGLAVLLAVAMVAVAFAGTTTKLTLKAGEEIYTCNCGEGCPCQTLSRAAGNCACGNPLVKAKVVKVEGGMAYLQAQGWEKPRPFNTVGKYACACGPDCKCDTISQKPGKCACGKEMKEVT